MTSHRSTRARSAVLALGVVLALAACSTRSDAPASPRGSAPHAPSPTAARASAAPSEDPRVSPVSGCGPATIKAVRDALATIGGYRYMASGVVHEEVFPADPDQSPTTRQVPISFEGAYQAPDRGFLRYTSGAPEGDPAETRTIGRDLWVLTDDGWQNLRGAVASGETNVIVALIDDAGDDWTAHAEPALAGGGCLLVARQPTPDEGTRELSIHVDPKTGLPTILRAEVRDALDRLGNRQDSRLEYRLTPDPDVVVEAPGRALPPS